MEDAFMLISSSSDDESGDDHKQAILIQREAHEARTARLERSSYRYEDIYISSDESEDESISEDNHLLCDTDCDDDDCACTHNHLPDHPPAPSAQKTKRHIVGSNYMYHQRPTKSQKTMNQQAKRRQQNKCHPNTIKKELRDLLANKVCDCHIDMKMVGAIATHRRWFFDLPTTQAERDFIKQEIGNFTRGNTVANPKRVNLRLPVMKKMLCESCWRLVYGIGKERFRLMKNQVMKNNNYDTDRRPYFRKGVVTEKTCSWLRQFFNQVRFFVYYGTPLYVYHL
jgi:hypothetical protein